MTPEGAPGEVSAFSEEEEEEDEDEGGEATAVAAAAEVFHFQDRRRQRNIVAPSVDVAVFLGWGGGVIFQVQTLEAPRAKTGHLHA